MWLHRGQRRLGHRHRGVRGPLAGLDGRRGDAVHVGRGEELGALVHIVGHINNVTQQFALRRENVIAKVLFLLCIVSFLFSQKISFIVW